MIFKYIPKSIKILIRKIIYFGNGYYCNVCNSPIKRFNPGGLASEAITKYNIVGAGYHEQDTCPICKSSYRQRLETLYLNSINEPKPSKKLLHIAPEDCLHYIFKKKLKAGYVCGDIEPTRYTYYANPVKIDVTQIGFSNNSFDIIVCNHVLEHVTNDLLAMQELYRVLKPGGFALLQVPISFELESTYEDNSITKPEHKLKAFGQKDHVRIYGQDYISRLTKAGFRVETIPSTSFSYMKNYTRFALDPQEKLFVCKKP